MTRESDFTCLKDFSTSRSISGESQRLLSDSAISAFALLLSRTFSLPDFRTASLPVFRAFRCDYRAKQLEEDGIPGSGSGM